MSESRSPDSASLHNASNVISERETSWPLTFLITALVPVVAATILYQLDTFDPAPLPPGELTRHVIAAPARNSRMLEGSERVGFGHLVGPEDIAYDPSSGVFYTGCADGWINRVTVNDSVVRKWINTGGRPLGIAVGRNNELIVADAAKGLLNVTAEGMVELLTDEAEGQKFKTTDGVDVAQNGMIYFTDASYKYSLSEFIWDILEGKPHGRLMSYDPATGRTKVLVRNLFFANGVAVSPDQNYVIFCETPVRRCRKYIIQGKEKGKVEKFVDYLPGMPDNIRYDGEGHYWIAFPTEPTLSWHLAFRYLFIRKGIAIMEKYIGRPNMEKNGGVLAVDLAGKPTAHYHDPGLSMVTTGIKIGDHLYCGSLVSPYIIRLNLKQYPAT
ncbi:protein STRICTOSIDINE SYNTHASE-LIKE 6-like [Alnus glutinosa]|uniref:protein STRICTOSIDINE SYNTHASE-LIKE 6-like n=1 Tax=Alnus glutinosa TaxID=3517 RepID=UPI002D76CB58|nr:protein STRICTOSIDINE SYNTHASE-LIKE 6-like [Alnus glutinosa]